MEREIKYSCEVPSKGLKGFTHINPSTTFPSPTEGVYYWHVVNFTPDLPKFKTLLVFEKVFQIWQAAFDAIPPVGRVIQLKSTKDIRQANIIISFGPSEHLIHTSQQTMTCPDYFDGTYGVLGHAWSMVQHQPYGGQVHLDEDESWTDMFSIDSPKIDLLSVILHEIGHVFDLGHTNVKGALMSAFYDGPVYKLGHDDHKGLGNKFSEIKLEVLNNTVQIGPYKNTEHKSILSRFIAMFLWIIGR